MAKNELNPGNLNQRVATYTSWVLCQERNEKLCPSCPIIKSDGAIHSLCIAE